MRKRNEMAAVDAKEQLRRWDTGRAIWTIEMSGLGPGYEQCIQVLAIEIVRDEIGKMLPNPAPSKWADRTVSRVNDACGGFSRAQVGAAKQLAYKWLSIGPQAVLMEVEDERHIQASNFWPKAS